jgi:hypothetical protein
MMLREQFDKKDKRKCLMILLKKFRVRKKNFFFLIINLCSNVFLKIHYKEMANFLTRFPKLFA